MDWSDLERIGWVRRENCLNGKNNLYYLSPPQKGLCRKIKNVNDLNESEKHLSLILFPTNKRATTNADKVSNLQTPSKVAKNSSPTSQIRVLG